MQKENNLAVGQWCDHWFTANRHKWNSNTEGGYRNLIYSHIIPSIGSVALSDLTKQTITDFYDSLRSRGLGARSVWCVHLLLRRCLDETARDRLIPYNPVRLCREPPCREGTKRMNELLWAMRDYRLSESDFHMLTDLGEMISVTAFCNLGRNSYHTLETAIKYFPEEFKDHLRGDCALCELDREPIEPGGLPYNRIRLEIDPSICRGCSKCSRSCHAEAITGVIKSPFVIDPEKCVKCYTCIEACPFDAIQEVEIDG